MPQSAFVYFEANQAMVLKLDLFSVSGEKVRSLGGQGAFPRGKGQIEWDLKNDWGHDVASGVYVARLWAETDGGILEAWTRIAVSR